MEKGLTSQFSNITSLSIVFRYCYSSLVKFSYWSKFHCNIMTGSGVMTIFIYRDWPEIRNTPVWILPNIWRLGQLGIPNLAWMSLVKYCWKLQNIRVCRIKGDLTRKGEWYIWGRVDTPVHKNKEKSCLISDITM